jgi:hypothetical protein
MRRALEQRLCQARNDSPSLNLLQMIPGLYCSWLVFAHYPACHPPQPSDPKAVHFARSDADITYISLFIPASLSDEILHALGGLSRQIPSYETGGTCRRLSQRQMKGAQAGEILISKTCCQPVKTARQMFFRKLKSRPIKDI